MEHGGAMGRTTRSGSKELREMDSGRIGRARTGSKMADNGRAPGEHSLRSTSAYVCVLRSEEPRVG